MGMGVGHKVRVLISMDVLWPFIIASTEDSFPFRDGTTFSSTVRDTERCV